MVELNKNKDELIAIDELILLLQKNIEITYLDDQNKINTLGTIHQPTIQDIIACGGETIFASYISMFCLSIDLLLEEFQLKQIIESEIGINNIKLFDLFFLLLNNDENINTNAKVKQYNSLLLKALSFFYKTNNIKFHIEEVIEIIVDDKYKINRENFDILCSYIRKITNSKVPKKEKIPNFKNERQEDIYYKLMAGRKRQAEREHISIKNMIDLVLINNNFNYDNLLNKTYIQLINDYNLAYLKYTSGAIQPTYTIDIAPKDDKVNLCLLENIKTIKIN
ncbi:hypothetical protein IRP62_11935 (plasmid) [Clostridium botulinum]|uniref:hypothetical protein n=1 Tax=Clostridium botulinum C phage TaxID=12336 RepID=UPI00005DB565|nr:hypothetical protein [Clostridium botulinum]YP_398588.1 hypothetical protein CST158 [Clostridium phage c-st]QPW54307.1 hypothetical protein IRP62_11935 [Clostridium botulinum]BAE47856.1 hypothetical protein CST158 [Clostridium phage c-st]